MISQEKINCTYHFEVMSVNSAIRQTVVTCRYNNNSDQNKPIVAAAISFVSRGFLTQINHVVHVTASAQWLASGPGHSVGGGPSGGKLIEVPIKNVPNEFPEILPGDPLWPRLGPSVHENGRGDVRDSREGQELCCHLSSGYYSRS